MRRLIGAGPLPPCQARGITKIAKAGWDARPLARSVESSQYSQGDLRLMMRFVPAAAAALMLAAAHGSAWSQTVKLETSMGDVVVELDAQKAPKSVANFVMYAKAGHYNGTVFHRVIPNFMIQGGGAHQRSELGHVAVLHQRQGQCLSRSGQLA
jgi:Cyclophilin type peptidyl-prolyl cis-trans isomerase/CLD